MRYLLLTTTILACTSCSVTKLVKKIKTPDIDNSEVQVVIPLTLEKTQIYQPIPAQTQTKSHNKPLQYSQTNTVATVLGTIVLVLCFFPLVVIYTGLLIEYIKSFILKVLNRTK